MEVTSLVEPAIYSYQAILSPNDIRILELLPGGQEEPIRIRLSDEPLAALGKCEALSYVWGTNVRNEPIHCEGGIIKGTPNLLGALKHIRPISGESRFLWIDAICINQDDFEERAQQVPLMKYIYSKAARVLVWIGQEPSGAKGAFEWIHLLDEAAQSLGVSDNPNFQVDETFVFSNGSIIQNVIDSPVFPDLVDILASRQYFTRLWTIQEVALSDETKTLVLCGSFSCSWITFYNATRMLHNCNLLRNSVSLGFFEHIDSVENLRAMQKHHHKNELSFYNCMGRTEVPQRNVSIQQDRVFGVLGLLQDSTRVALSRLTYDTNLDEFYQVATIVMALESRSLYHLLWRDLVMDPEIPSWRSFTDHGQQYRFPFYPELTALFPRSLIYFEFGEQRLDFRSLVEAPIFPGETETMNSPILVTMGILYDEVLISFDNFEEANLSSQILSAFTQLRNTSTISTEEILGLLWLPLSLHDPNNDTIESSNNKRMSFMILFSKWALQHIENHQHQAFSEEDVAFFLDYSNLGVGALARSALKAFMLNREQFQVVGTHGRNLFITAKGRVGVGPMGRVDGEPAVKVRDQIAVIGGLPIPVVLRAVEGGLYRFVGPGHVPSIVDDDFLKTEIIPEMEMIRIR